MNFETVKHVAPSFFSIKYAEYGECLFKVLPLLF